MRAVLKFLLSLIVVFAIAWVGLWWYAEARMQTGFNNWADDLATQGWKLSYGTITRGTTPVTAKLTLTNLQLTPPPDAQGRTGTISLPAVTLRINALNPLLLYTDLPDRIGLDFGGEVDAVVTFTTIQLTEELDPNVLFNHGNYPYRSGDFSASGIDILASEGSLLVLHLDQATSHYAFDPEAGAGAQALSVDETLDGFAVSPLMTRLLSIPFDGRITHLDLVVNVSGPLPPGLPGLAAQLKAVPLSDQADQQKLLVPVIHNWAAAGGSGSITLGSIIGPTTMASDAAIKFDQNLQPEGNADLTADHLDAFFAAVTNAYPALQNQVAAIEAQLTNYITATDSGGQTLAVHMTYGGGAVTVNGQKVAPLPAVDWTTLENPPPPMAQGAGTASGQ
jgi:hypothetical protein